MKAVGKNKEDWKQIREQYMFSQAVVSYIAAGTESVNFSISQLWKRRLRPLAYL